MCLGMSSPLSNGDIRDQVRRPTERPAHLKRKPYWVSWWAANGFAVIPTAPIDPPHRAASPAVPALIGSGSPSRCLLNVGNLLKLAEQVGMMLGKVADHTCIPEQPRDVTSRQDKIEVVRAISLLD